MSEMEAAIKRLMKYCGKANKEINQSIESRKLVMDIELIYSGSMEMMEQRDAVLKLANKWELDERYSSVLPRHALSDCARELRAIFAQKE